MATTQWNAMGSLVSIAVTDALVMSAVRVACDEELSALYASFCPHEESDLVRANRAAGSWVPVAPMTIRLLTAAVRVATATSFLIPGSESWGRVGIDTDGAIQVPPGASLDLSPLVKAFAADLLVARVPDRTGASMIASVGNHLAVGRPAGADPYRWRVAVAERPLSEREAQRSRISGGVTERSAAYHRLSEHRREALVDTGELREADRPSSEVVGLESGALATSSARTPRRRLRVTSDYQLLSPGKGSSLDPLWHTASVRAGLHGRVRGVAGRHPARRAGTGLAVGARSAGPAGGGRRAGAAALRLA